MTWEKHVYDIEQFILTIDKESAYAIKPTREQFARLLAEPAASRRIPGISVRMNYKENYKCTPEEAVQTKEFLKKMFSIDSKESLIEYQRVQFTGSVQYEQFMTFWKTAPLFDVKELNPDALKIFEECKARAEAFYPVVKEKGLYAWDICEYIGICRVANACGIITDEDFDEIVDHFVRKAQVFYHSFKEYALSYLYGAMYFMRKEDTFDQFIDIQKKVVKNLFEYDNPWQRYAWYRPAEREWAQVYPQNLACFITKAAQDNGIGYMYREEGDPDNPDSGWRFFHGDETDEYVSDIENIKIVSLNTICNNRPDILAFLEAPCNSAYWWNGTDWIKAEVFD
jgi:hypothetical protein